MMFLTISTLHGITKCLSSLPALKASGPVMRVPTAVPAHGAIGIQDAKARIRAERTWAKDLSRLSKLANARQSGAAPGGLFLGHRAHVS